MDADLTHMIYKASQLTNTITDNIDGHLSPEHREQIIHFYLFLSSASFRRVSNPSNTNYTSQRVTTINNNNNNDDTIGACRHIQIIIMITNSGTCISLPKSCLFFKIVQSIVRWTAPDAPATSTPMHLGRNSLKLVATRCYDPVCVRAFLAMLRTTRTL